MNYPQRESTAGDVRRCIMQQASSRDDDRGLAGPILSNFQTFFKLVVFRANQIFNLSHNTLWSCKSLYLSYVNVTAPRAWMEICWIKQIYFFFNPAVDGGR